MKKATLTLQDGTSFEGYSFGAEKNIVGEVVFNTAMNGYPESLTDPSYMGQIMVMTYPMVGNYGIPSFEVSPEGISHYLESEHIYMQAILVADYSTEYSHWNATSSLGDRLREEGTVGLTNIDTRALTKHLREHGSQKGTITIEGVDTTIEDARWEERNLVAEASTREVVRYRQGSKTVVLLDCGIQHNIIRQLLREDVTLVRVPWDYDFSTLSYDGIFISNGPGNPEMCVKTVENLRRAIAGDKPIYGICMGNQLLSLAAGAKIYKLKYGHRSHNQPVRMVGTNNCFITSQNHSFAVDGSTLGADWEEWIVNLNDGSNEGIKHKTKPIRSVQFHPEAFGGPKDTLFIFDEFLSLL